MGAAQIIFGVSFFFLPACLLLNKTGLEAPQQEVFVIKEKNVPKLSKGLEAPEPQLIARQSFGKCHPSPPCLHSSSSFFWKGPLLKTQWSHRGRGRIGSLPPGSSEKLPVSDRHSPIFWLALTLGMRATFFGGIIKEVLGGHAAVCSKLLFLNEKLNLRWSLPILVSSICRGFIFIVIFFLWLSVVIYFSGLPAFLQTASFSYTSVSDFLLPRMIFNSPQRTSFFLLNVSWWRK